MSNQMDLFGSGGAATAVLPNANEFGERNNREEIELQLGVIEAETWAARHKFHKYWGKKPANVVERYVRHFTTPGEAVCDPFCGSGVTAVEAVIAKRNFIGFDINPFAVRHTKALLYPPDVAKFAEAAKRIAGAVGKEAVELFSTNCRKCGKSTEVKSYLYEGDVMQEVRYKCASCGSVAAEPDAYDLALASAPHSAPCGTPDADIFYGWQMRKLKRRSVRRWSEMFTSRNFRIAGLIWREIMKVEDERVKEWAMLTFTAGLAQFTKMIADYKGAGGGPSWKINCYWLPDRWQELNPLRFFENRVKRSIAAIADLNKSGAPFACKGLVHATDSRNLPLEDASVDYIFTDPPYGGEGIQYGELSMLWCIWLGEEQKLESEIAFNPVRGLSERDYANGLKSSFSEAYRILKPGKAMTVTFANKDPDVWDALMEACRSAGFRLLTAAPMERSAPSLTETTMARAPKADLVLTFERPITNVKGRKYVAKDTYDLKQRILVLANKLASKGLPVNASHIYDMITIDWFSWYYENGARPNSLRPTQGAIIGILNALESQKEIHA